MSFTHFPPQDDEDEEEEEEAEEDVEAVALDGEIAAVDEVDEEEEVWEDDEEEEYTDAVALEGTVAADADEDWDMDDDGGEYPLEDDPDDPNYQRQKELLEQAIADADLKDRDENFDALDFVMNEMTEEQMEEMNQTPFIKEVKERSKKLMLTEEDVKDIDIEAEMEKVSDLMDDDPYPRHEDGEINYLELENGITDDDMEELDKAWKTARRAEQNNWYTFEERSQLGLDNLSNETLTEIEACLDELGGSAYNITQWLLYDLDFNVTNLMLAAVKHNREAPILFHHWYPQLVTYKRYASARARDFDFTPEDVQNADLSELERYYAGFGYSEIPHKAPAETGIIEASDLDEEEAKMVAFESWFIEVYNEEVDKLDFDDDEMKDEDNVFSDFYERPDHPELPKFDDALQDIEEWKEEIGDDEEDFAYRDYLGQVKNYTYVEDKELDEEMRGHLIVACTTEDADLEVAEKITLAMEKNFGKQIYVETRVFTAAQPEDNVFEVWIESYEIELLHSKKRATSNAQDWDGPAECDDKQIEYLVETIRSMISDEARYSYSMDFEGVIE